MGIWHEKSHKYYMSEIFDVEIYINIKKSNPKKLEESHVR